MEELFLNRSASTWIRVFPAKMARPADDFLDLGRLGLVLEPLDPE